MTTPTLKAARLPADRGMRHPHATVSRYSVNRESTPTTPVTS